MFFCVYGLPSRFYDSFQLSGRIGNSFPFPQQKYYLAIETNYDITVIFEVSGIVAFANLFSVFCCCGDALTVFLVLTDYKILWIVMFPEIVLLLPRSTFSFSFFYQILQD